ncbi:MAG: heparinase II/III family protein [Bacteroides sp.]|nr:heparinase II/III family protein [Bacteroides sp.]MCM1095945.1 heparinase II/III family protein [Terasakiella sp.]
MTAGGKILWYVRRLKAMSAGEVLWRISQTALAKAERLRYGRTHRAVDTPLYRGVGGMRFDAAPLGLVSDCPADTDTSSDIHIPGGYDYSVYVTDWHAGFQTPARWPLQWSYSLDYKQRDDIGDARTNWELNRHTQFVLMAKAYRLTASGVFLNELQSRLDSWTESNPFLWGISWTSPMEVAIRAINWLYAAGFLRTAKPRTDSDAALADALAARLTVGAANMVHYLTRHYSRGSSANNHLLVEMAAIWLGGACLGREDWCSLAEKVLSRELPRQFAPDGVNLEMSLHYHAFAMEAYLLVMHSARAVGRTVPPEWSETMERAAQFVAHSRVTPGLMCEFGDSDEGRILNMSSRPADYYTYILQLCSLVLDRRYDDFASPDTTVTWLYPAADIERVCGLAEYRADGSRTFEQGGYTFLRSGGVFAGFDHAPLGFGSIAAHGHADALSFQLFIDGIQVLADSGTYIYHIDLPARNLLRTTAMHNTVVIDGCEQSEMLGAFLWGRRAATGLRSYTSQSVEASTTGLSGVTHTRRLTAYPDGVDVADSFSRPCRWTASFIVAPGLDVKPAGDGIDLGGVARLTFGAGTAEIEDIRLSPAYGVKAAARCVRVSGRGDSASFGIRKTSKT